MDNSTSPAEARSPPPRHDGVSITYFGIARRAAVAAHLDVAAAARGGPVIVLLTGEPAWEASAILGVRSAGAIAVPVEAHQPAHRLQQIVDHRQLTPKALEFAERCRIQLVQQCLPDSARLLEAVDVLKRKVWRTAGLTEIRGRS